MCILTNKKLVVHGTRAYVDACPEDVRARGRHPDFGTRLNIPAWGTPEMWYTSRRWEWGVLENWGSEARTVRIRMMRTCGRPLGRAGRGRGTGGGGRRRRPNAQGLLEEPHAHADAVDLGAAIPLVHGDALRLLGAAHEHEHLQAKQAAARVGRRAGRRAPTPRHSPRPTRAAAHNRAGKKQRRRVSVLRSALGLRRRSVGRGEAAAPPARAPPPPPAPRPRATRSALRPPAKWPPPVAPPPKR